MKIRDMLLADQTLFRNEEVFSQNYVPEEIMYRDGQIRELVLSLKPALRNGKAANCLLIGPPATGKTTCAKAVFDEVSGRKLLCVHVNCLLHDTPFKIFSEIHKSVFGFKPPETGAPLTSVYDKIFSRLSKEGKTLAVALDEAGRLFSSGAANDVFYKILRAYEAYPDAKTCLWAVSSSNEMHRLDDRVRSIFMPDVVSFGKYTMKEMKEILKKRCDAGLHKGVVPDEITDFVCNNAKDLRHAIESMRKAVLLAEGGAMKKVEMRHAEKALGIQKKEINPDEKAVMDALKNGPLDAGRLHSMTRMSYTKFHRTLKKMESEGMIKIIPATKGRGKTSVISLV